MKPGNRRNDNAGRYVIVRPDGGAISCLDSLIVAERERCIRAARRAIHEVAVMPLSIDPELQDRIRAGMANAVEIYVRKACLSG